MHAERARDFLLSLPYVGETEQFGGLIYWVGNKVLGGKMCALVNLQPGELPMSFAVGPERYSELLERDGLRPAPYLARAFWVAAERWDVFGHREWEGELRAAHAVTLAKLTPSTRRKLELPAAELKKLVAERRRVLAAREAEKAGRSPNSSR